MSGVGERPNPLWVKDFRVLPVSPQNIVSTH